MQHYYKRIEVAYNYSVFLLFHDKETPVLVPIVQLDPVILTKVQYGSNK